MKLRDKFLFNQSYIYHGDLAAFEARLMSLKDPFAIKKSALQFEIQPQESFGTVQTEGLPIQPKGIYVRINLTELGEDMYRVHFNTSLRIDHFFLAAMHILLLIACYTEAQQVKVYLIVMVSWLICTAWFQAIYRAQEESCVDEVVLQLRLRREKRRRTPKRRRRGL